jgi:hypothetical protein
MESLQMSAYERASFVVSSGTVNGERKSINLGQFHNVDVNAVC